MNLNNDEQKATLTLAHKDYQKGLTTYASFKVSSNTLSEDLVQDTFIKTWSYLVKGGEIVKMKAFLYHVLNGLIIDEYRKRKTTSLDALIENGYEPSLDEANKHSNMFDGEMAILLIAYLPKEYRKVMRMRYVQDLSLAEMAEITGKTKNTIAVHAHRGLEKLKILYFQKQKLSLL